MRLPLSVKFSGIVLTVLVVSIVVITYLATDLFFKDKTNYIFELNTFAARDRSESVSATLSHLQEKIRIFTRTYQTSFANQDVKASLLNSFFSQYQEFVSLSLYREDNSKVHLFESRKLSSVGIKMSSVEQHLEKSGLSVKKVLSGQRFFANATLDQKLNAFALAIPIPGVTARGRQIAVALIDLRQLNPSSGEQGIQESYIIDNRGRIISHTDMMYVYKQADFSSYEIVKDMFSNSGRVRAGTKEFTAPDGEVMLGAFSLLDKSLGGVVVQVPKSVAFQGAITLILQVSLVAGIILVIAAVIALFLAGSVTRPVMELARATRRIARGEFSLKLKARSKDEIGDLAHSFNQMGSELLDRQKALEEANKKLIQSEKMAAFGQLGAGIAHEVKNPLAGILGYAQLAKKKIPEDHEVHKNLAIIEKETKRCKEIIENLLKFARHEKAEFQNININEIASDALVLVEHQLTLHKVKIHQSISNDVYTISGNANQLQQVLMNLMINAQHAMEPDGGELFISTKVSNDNIAEVHIRDTGHGIPEDVKKRIFEPFFTTKPAGKGTGLGLSVTYGIIQDHKGDIIVESEQNKGTEFVICIPLVEKVKKTLSNAESPAIADQGATVNA